MPPESRDDKDILNQSNNHENTSQTDFPEIEEYFGDDESKKGSILNVLKNGNIGDVFKKILNSKKSENCLFALLECKNDETKIKEVILANLPEGYVYNFSTGSIVENQLDALNNNFSGATTTDKKEEEVVKKEEEVVKKEEEIGMDVENMNRENAMRQVIEERDRLVDKYENLEEKTDPKSENYQAVKTQLERNGVINQLKTQLNDQITEGDKNKKNEIINKFIDDYILVQTTLTELKSNPTIYDKNDISYFDKIVKNLDNACNIPDTNLNSFSSENITRTRHELFNSDIGNQDLIETKKSNLKSRDYTDLFPDKSEKELINEYGKFLDNEQIKSLIIKYNNNENLTDEEKNYLITGCRRAKEQIDNKTKDMVEELCLISQIKGMYMCMGEGADFQMNKSNEIESKDGILTLNGHIDGIDFSIRQDTNDPDARLQTSTRLHKKDNAFEIGNHFEDSNFILPSQSEVFNLAVKSVNSDGALQEAETPADYVSKLQDKIMSKMDDMYEDTKYANHYMHEQVKGEKVVDKAIGLVQNLKKSEMPTAITESNRGLFDFVGLIHFNIKNSTSLEKDRMNSCLEKIQNLVNEYQDTDKQPESGKYPPIIEHYLTDKTILKNTENLLNGGIVEGESLFDLFNQYK